jgi:hypothetical protein
MGPPDFLILRPRWDVRDRQLSIWDEKVGACPNVFQSFGNDRLSKAYFKVEMKRRKNVDDSGLYKHTHTHTHTHIKIGLNCSIPNNNEQCHILFTTTTNFGTGKCPTGFSRKLSWVIKIRRFQFSLKKFGALCDELNLTVCLFAPSVVWNVDRGAEDTGVQRDLNVHEPAVKPKTFSLHLFFIKTVNLQYGKLTPRYRDAQMFVKVKAHMTKARPSHYSPQVRLKFCLYWLVPLPQHDSSRPTYSWPWR